MTHRLLALGLLLAVSLSAPTAYAQKDQKERSAPSARPAPGGNVPQTEPLAGPLQGGGGNVPQTAQDRPPPPPYWGAIGFTADGSWATAWRASSKAEAEAKVALDCAKFGRGKCEVESFPGTLCVGLASYQGTHSRTRYKLAFTAGGTTTPEAQKAAVDRCNADQRTRRNCQLRTVVCGDGR
jgi:hypothetical protein